MLRLLVLLLMFVVPVVSYVGELDYFRGECLRDGSSVSFSRGDIYVDCREVRGELPEMGVVSPGKTGGR